MRRSTVRYWAKLSFAIIAIGVLVLSSTTRVAQVPDTAELRTVRQLMEGWRFVQDDSLTDQDALAATADDWSTVSLPHTWNAEDAASLEAEDYVRGIGWYRLEFDSPTAGARHWLELGAASLVADVWLNGQYLGQHRGGFTAFRFDVTDLLASSAPNVLLVKVDNRAPRSESDPTAITPLGGDYNRPGGLYRHVELISTPAAAHFALDDFGGSAVYATTTSIGSVAPGDGSPPPAGPATVSVLARLSAAAEAAGEYVVRFSLIDGTGAAAGSGEVPVSLAADTPADIAADISVPAARLWHGRADPYLYQLSAELVDAAGTPIDRVVQSFGIREMRFDPNEGFFLNGEPIRLNGVAVHQDFLGRAWAVTDDEMELSLGLIQEVGARAIRLGHYPFPEYMLQRVSELGFVVWSEMPSGLRTTVERCSTTDPTPEFMANARQQLQELIRQQYNFPAVAVWSIGNETEAGQSGCAEDYDNVTPYLQELHALAKQEDPARPTATAEFTQGLEGGTNLFGDVALTTAGITDVLGTNRYYLWYALELEEFSPLLDVIHERFPNQPLAVSEYGAGAALTHHTDNVRGGPPEVRSAPEGETSYQPEEYQAFVHEEVWRLLSSKPYLWGTFVWNMFDFGSAHRNEGDVLGVNTKGLVTFDRRIRKDAFFFYKSNWSSEPVTHIVGRRYVDRAYAVTDVRVYSNGDSVELAVSGTPVGVLTGDQCEQRTCIFENVSLVEGTNTVTATGTHGAEIVTDTVEWTVQDADTVNIAAGRLTTGYVASDGSRFGSDEFFVGGTGAYIELGEDARGGVPEDIEDTEEPMLYKYFRHGEFSYEIPVPNGRYAVTLGFVEPDSDIDEGERVFNVLANGTTVLEEYDVLAEAGDDRAAERETFTVDVTTGLLTLQFAPVQGEAIVSNIRVTPFVSDLVPTDE